MLKGGMDDVIKTISGMDKLDFSVGDIVTVTEGEYRGIGLKLMKIMENGECILRISPDNEITINMYFDKVKSIASFEEGYAKVTEQTVIGVFGGRNLH